MPDCLAYRTQTVRNRCMTVHTVTLNQLESHLREAANILRGPADAADFKTYVFPLLFFKRLSDVHDEEYQPALEESGGNEEYARFPQNYCGREPLHELRDEALGHLVPGGQGSHHGVGHTVATR